MADWIEDAEATFNESNIIAVAIMLRKSRILNMGLLHNDSFIAGISLHLAAFGEYKDLFYSTKFYKRAYPNYFGIFHSKFKTHIHSLDSPDFFIENPEIDSFIAFITVL